MMQAVVPRYSLVFPGQGSQYVSMCYTAYQQDSRVVDLFSEASAVLSQDMAALIFDGSLAALTRSEHAQPAVLLVSYALFSVFSAAVSHPPEVLAGHSLGEVSAYVAAGALSFSDALQFVKVRSSLMQSACDAALGEAALVTDMSRSALQERILSIEKEHVITITAYNASNQFVVAGSSAAIRALRAHADDGVAEIIPFRMIPMKANAPYHSALMQQYQPALNAALAEVTFFDPQQPVISSVSGQAVTEAFAVKAALAKQLVSPVQWQSVMLYLGSLLAPIIEIGPQQTLRNLAKADSEEGCERFFAFDDVDERSIVIEQLSLSERVI